MSSEIPLALQVPLQGRHLVEASAGTGKTWTLCLLYARLIVEHGRIPRDILVVTFTTAATAELRERIRRQLAAALAALSKPAVPADTATTALLDRLHTAGVSSETARDRLRQALAEFDDAAIQTIHGFCHRALADTPLASGSPIELAFLTDDDPLTPQACADAWRACFANPAARPLSDALLAQLTETPITPATLVPLVRRRLAKPLAREIWPPAPAAGELVTDRLRVDFAALAAAWPAAVPDLRAGFEAARADRTLNGTVYKTTAITACLDAWTTWLAAGDPLAPLPDKAELIDCGRGKRVNQGRTPPEHPALAAAVHLLRQCETLSSAVERARLTLLRELLDDAARRLQVLKRHLAQASYDDILGNLHAALTGPRGDRLAAALRARHPAALIDEFQDTDPLQLAIVRRIWIPAPDTADPATAVVLYLVGDPKQAIYAFRNADVHTYLSARDHVDAVHALAANQRASTGLIDALNQVFGHTAAPFALAGLHYPPAVAGAKPRGRLIDPAGVPPLDLWHIADDLPRPVAEATLLAATAGEIARLLADPAVHLQPPDGLPRRLTPADIVVLVRTHRQARRVRTALAVAGLAAVEQSQASVFHSTEAGEVRRLLAALIDPADRRRVNAALATELAGFPASAFDPANAAALAEARESFATAAARWRAQGFARAWRQLLADLDAIHRTLAGPDGERRLTNLRHLAEQVYPLADRHGPGDALLRAFDDLSGQPRGDALQLRLESDRDLIHIVTIHRAKGLEYPVVFCPFLCEPVMRARDTGLGIECRDRTGSLIDFDPARIAAGRAAAALEAFAEHLRLIYVATTRAEHRLVLPLGCWPDGRGSSKTLRAAPLHWLAAGGSHPDAAAAWLEHPPTADHLAAAWQALVAGTPAIGLRPPPTANPAQPPLAVPAAVALAARRAERRLVRDWQIGSFTGLMRAAAPCPAVATAVHDDAPASDHDRPASLEAPPSIPDPTPDFLTFPRGAWAGESLHAVLERIDFSAPASWPAAVASTLANRPPERQGDGRQWGPAVLALLRDLAATPLPAAGGGILRLSDLRPEDRLPEWPFVLPATIDGPSFAARLSAAGLPVPELTGGRIDGYLKGIVDLVYRHNSRYYLLDWKSNHLGDHPADYTPACLDAAMRTHGYALQAQFYLLALHRFLAARLPGYHPATHLGGIHYLFLRGLCADGQTSCVPRGVWHRPADAALLMDLDRLCQR